MQKCAESSLLVRYAKILSDVVNKSSQTIRVSGLLARKSLQGVFLTQSVFLFSHAMQFSPLAEGSQGPGPRYIVYIVCIALRKTFFIHVCHLD